jgi:hypothetical protein
VRTCWFQAVLILLVGGYTNNMRYYSGICPKGLRKATKTSGRIASVSAEIRTEHIRDTYQVLYRDTKVLGASSVSETGSYVPNSIYAHTLTSHKGLA